MNNKQKIAISAIIAILIAVMAAAWSGQESVGHAQLDIHVKRSTSDATEWMDDARRQLGLAPNVYLLAAANDEMTGDNALDAVLLVGTKTKVEDRFASNIDIIIRDGKSGRFVTTALSNVSGYDSSLFIGDFNGDKVNDVMVTAPSGGSGGANYTIAAFPGFIPSVLFSGKDNTSASFSGRFLDDFQMELVNSDTGRKTRVDITDAKSRYIENGIYSTEGKLLKSIAPQALPNSSLEPIDLNHDGTYELKGVQKIVGASSADVVAQVYSYWQYTSSHRWNLQQLEVASLLLGLSQETLPNSVPPDQAVSKQMKSEYADVSYPQFTEMSNLLTRDYVNQALETAARELVNHATSDSHVIAEYEVTRSDSKILSVIFKNSQKQEKGESPILQSINIDLKNRAIVSAVDLFRSDRQSRRSIDSLIADAAKQANRPDAPTLSDSMGVYITNRDIVLYDQLSDDKSETERLYLPLEKAKPYLKEPFAPAKGS